MELQGAVVVVTGGASGIGRALARESARVGASCVVVADIDAAGAAAVAAEIGGIAREVDVSQEASIAELVTATESEVGPIDLYCSNAGILAIGGPEVPDEVWRRIIDVNVMAHVWAARHLVPRMLERNRGWFLLTASAAGLLTQIGSAPYSVTKHAAVAFADWLAITYGDAGLGVSALCPQAVETAMTAGIPGGGVAGVDGMIGPEQVAAEAVAAVIEERFLVLPHPEVATYAERRATDHERWIRGMRRLQGRFAP